MTPLDRPDQGLVAADDQAWVDVCAFDDLVPDRGVAALIDDVAVAVFRCWPDDDLYALANIDPYSRASVLSRGIVGSVADVPVVVSPMFKHRFDLRTGLALDDPTMGVAAFDVEVVGGRVLVAVAPRAPDTRP